MTDALDVLVISSHPNAGADAEVVLRAAGHRVHKCYEPDGTGFPCKGLQDDGCPIDHSVDVALLVRNGVTPRPTSLENGAICAVRAGIPIVEQGSANLDPFEPWVDVRLDATDDAAQACESAQHEAFEPLRLEIVSNAVRHLHEEDTATADLTCDISRDGDRLLVELKGPDLPRNLRQALALHVLSAVQRAGIAADPLDVSYTAAA